MMMAGVMKMEDQLMLLKIKAMDLLLKTVVI